jgi:MraZ protein
VHNLTTLHKPGPFFLGESKTKMFIGEYEASIDEKGRVAVPAKFRAALKGKVVVTRGLDQSLFLYPTGEWKTMAEKLASLPISTANTRAFSRLMLAGAMDCELDKQGRITLPGYLQQFAGLAKRIIFAGLYNRVEIWSEDRWKAYKAETEKESTVIAEQLGSLGV